MLNKVLDLHQEGKIAMSLDVLFDEIDDYLINDNFDAVDEYLFSMKLSNYPIDILIGFLTITLMARNKLKHRDLFRERVEFELRNRNVPSNEIENLISGL